MAAPILDAISRLALWQWPGERVRSCRVHSTQQYIRTHQADRDVNMIRLLAPLAILMISGCDSFHRVAYSVGSTAQYQGTGDVKDLCDRLAEVADRNSLEQRSSNRADTLCYFSNHEWGLVVIGTRTLNQHIVVDLQAVNRESAYRKIQPQLQQMLETHYPGAFIEVTGGVAP